MLRFGPGVRSPLLLTPDRAASPGMVPLGRRSFAEFLGTGLLVTAVVGSGIAAERLSPGEPGIQLLVNALATVAALVAILLSLGPVSGGHLNPVITLLARGRCGLSTREAGAYVAAQVAGGAAGAVLANLMFDLPPVHLSSAARSSPGLWLAEMVATFGLVLVVLGVARSGRPSAAPAAVAAYIGSAYFFTASTSFANPAVTLARTLSDTFSGIGAGSVPAFVAAQAAGGLLAWGVAHLLFPAAEAAGGGADAANVVVPHPPVTRSDWRSRARNA